VTTAGEEGPVRPKGMMGLLGASAALRRDREHRGLTLAEVSERSGLGRHSLWNAHKLIQ
jgi:hypothetical protein